MRYRKFPLYIFLVLIVLMTTSLQAKQGNSLPPLPSSDVINQVINQTGGPTYTPLIAPKNIKQSLKTSGGAFEGIHKKLSRKDAINYLATTGVVKEVVVPISDSGVEVLEPDITAPGPEERPGQVIGAVYQPLRGTMVLVVVFKDHGKPKPENVRMYDENGHYYEYPIQKDKFNKPTDDTFDEGAILSYNQSCVTVGKNQVCWETDISAGAREDSYPKDLVTAAYERARVNYDLKTKFFLDDAVPDLIGTVTRANCADALKTAVLPEGAEAPALAVCDPNLYVSASQEKKDDEPIALWVVDQQADLKGFTYTGTYLGYVPVGEYLVVNATPQATTPGDVGVLMLVNINSDQHYLIPSIRIQQFADKKKPKPQMAAIKDGATWYYGW
jgi:hypothetical protein